MAYSTLSSKGQVTIPKDLRDNLNLKTGDKVDFELEDDQIKIQKIDPFDKAYQQSVEGTFSEWFSGEDKNACGNL